MIPASLQGNLQELSKKIVLFLFIILLLFAGIIALTQELPFQPDDLLPVPGDEFIEDEFAEHEEDTDQESFIHYYFLREMPDWVRPARWFRSNAGGMALEEIPSRVAALRNEYALVIDFTSPDELPEYLADYFEQEYILEIRKLYKHGEETRMQWLFRDFDGTTRFIAVLREIIKEETENTEVDEDTYINETYDDVSEDEIIYNAAAEEISEKIILNGFIEIFNENGFITLEYRYYEDGSIYKTIYNYTDNVIISAVSLVWEENNEGGHFTESYTDYFRYNRSSFLRAVERHFYSDMQIPSPDDFVRLSFPGNILNAARQDSFINEKLNPYPEFFGDLGVMININARMVFSTDERGRIISQTLYDEQDEVIWEIVNTWLGERIISISKTMGDIEFLAEYEYDSGGNRISERNIRNGILERLVRTEGNTDIEELYLNNVIVMQAVWEDGRKISETRVRNN